MFHRNKLSVCTLPWRIKNTIHKRSHGGDIIIHRIMLSHNDLFNREGVKHDLEKYFLKLSSSEKNNSLLIKSILFSKRPPFTL